MDNIVYNMIARIGQGICKVQKNGIFNVLEKL